MIRYLPLLIEFSLLVFALIDCIQTDSILVRNLPKMVWVLLIIFVPIAGPVAWLVAGRPAAQQRRRVPWPSTATAGFPEYERPRPIAPDDDPEYLAQLEASDARHEQMLAEWEAQLREREERLRSVEGQSGTERSGGPEGSSGSHEAEGEPAS